MSPLIHRPLGGHAYRVEPDQRHPAIPLAGEPLELRVLADPAATAVWLELDPGERIAMQQIGLATLYREAAGLTDPGDGHLGDASRALPNIGDHRVWVTTLPALDGDSFRYRFAADGVESAWFDVHPAAWGSAGGTVDVIGGADRLVAEHTQFLTTAAGPVKVRFALRLAPGEHVVGFGERYDALDQRGKRLDTVVFEQYTSQGNRTYLPSPFAVVAGGDGWGFHVRTSRRVWFDVGVTDPDLLWVEVGLDPANPAIEVRLYDGTPAELVSAHIAEVGGLRLPPQWVLRPWMSANDWNTQERVEAEVARSIELDVPVGVVVIEAWADEQTFCVFRDSQYEVRPDGAPLSLADITFPPDGAWPDPVGMVQRLHDLGVKVVLWQIPLVPTDRGEEGQVAADARTMIERGFAVREADGSAYRNRGWWFPGAVLPDWTNPEARDWWLAKRRYLLTEVGIDGFKTDGGEHAWGDDLVHADGSRGAQTNNLFPLQYSQAYTELLDECGTDGVVFSRAGFTGAGTAPCHWAGDERSTWEAFRASITAGLTAAMSGVAFWGWDIAGFSGDIPDVELWVRATAMAAFCPIMQYHSEFNDRREPCRDRTPWNIAARHNDPRALDLYRHFAKLREDLLPYLWEQSKLCVAENKPLMRPLCFDHPSDQKVWDFPYQYHLGSDLLVAPVTEPGVDLIPVYLPEGEWTDFFTGHIHRGPTVVHRMTKWDEVAVYVSGITSPRLSRNEP